MMAADNTQGTAAQPTQDPNKAEAELGDFTLGTPAIVCRWRLAGRTLPMTNRHLRALGARRVEGRLLSTNLVNWAKQHIEWTLDSGSFDHPDGVLMILVDDDQHAAMAVGPYEPLEARSTADLIDRAVAASLEGSDTGVSPEVLWLVQGSALTMLVSEGETLSASASLVKDLVDTLGFDLSRQALPLSVSHISDMVDAADEVFLASDEHGVVVAKTGESLSDASVAGRLAEGYERLLEVNRERKR